jgi:hypothetical protein
MSWQYPLSGQFPVAVPGNEEVASEVERFFGRELARYNHAVYCERHPYIVFFFAEKSDAEKCMTQFGGEWFDERDKGKGKHWAQWYRGKTAKRLNNRSPYDFGG